MSGLPPSTDGGCFGRCAGFHVSPINSQIGPFSTILHDVYSMYYYKDLEVGMLGDSNII